jgi:hypothetical protein
MNGPPAASFLKFDRGRGSFPWVDPLSVALMRVFMGVGVCWWWWW